MATQAVPITKRMGKTLAVWTPEDKKFWEQEGRAIANINLWISMPSLFLAFAVWQLWSVVAVNLPEHARNAIHTDEGAQAAGFPAALVAGVTTYAYLAHVPLAAWGIEWLTSGGGELDLRSPVFAGDRLRCRPVLGSDGRWIVDCGRRIRLADDRGDTAGCGRLAGRGERFATGFARLADEGAHVNQAGGDKLAAAVHHIGAFRHAGGADAFLRLAHDAFGNQQIADNIEAARRIDDPGVGEQDRTAVR